jgi:hypothetical protein
MRYAVPALAVLLAASGCGRKTPCKKAEEVASVFYRSMKLGDTKMAFQLTTGQDRRVLAEKASRISERTGKPIDPDEMLVPGLVSFRGDLNSATFKPVNVEVGDVQEVEVTFPDGTTVRTPVVREASCYRIPLGLGSSP